MKKSTPVRYAFVTALTTITLAANADFNAAIDFSPTNNPNGVWRYGWSPMIGGTFVLDAIHTHDASSGFDVWSGSVVSPLGNFPVVVHNGTNSTVNSGTVRYAPGQLGIHPGPNGEYSIVRFVAPTSGQFVISAVFGGLDLQLPTTTDVHVLVNNIQIFNGSVGSFGSGPSISVLRLLGSGDTVDFSVGFGSNATYFHDSTSLMATISPVPEISTSVMLGLGSVLVLATRRRRQASTAA